ncbi:uncharacterized protein LOC111643467 [Copidosoma floridanum]|uniref:uncharacterized protein LOC111643467 n=1 Tax=Copidosoma floridanum TaxID=29053 RepID=UPI000C6F8777|nr:uncharacterized protein LOC111643467 [Copidosoma floridanum]
MCKKPSDELLFVYHCAVIHLVFLDDDRTTTHRSTEENSCSSNRSCVHSWINIQRTVYEHISQHLRIALLKGPKFTVSVLLLRMLSCGLANKQHLVGEPSARAESVQQLLHR